MFGFENDYVLAQLADMRQRDMLRERENDRAAQRYRRPRQLPIFRLRLRNRGLRQSIPAVAPQLNDNPAV